MSQHIANLTPDFNDSLSSFFSLSTEFSRNVLFFWEEFWLSLPSWHKNICFCYLVNKCLNSVVTIQYCGTAYAHVSKIDSSLFAQSLTWNKPSTICSPERLQKSNICQTNNSFLLNSLPFKSDSLRYKSSLVTFSAFFLAPVMISPSIQQCKFCGKMLENL